MKKQILDTLIYNNTKYVFIDSPLYPYLVKFGYNPFYSPRTNCTRGYIAQWEIRDSKLYLISFKGFIRRRNRVDITYLFPNKTEVFADWFSEIVSVAFWHKSNHTDDVESTNDKVLYLGFCDGILIMNIDQGEEFIDLDNEPDLPF